MKKYTLAFDVYGTLINTSGVLEALEVLFGEKAKEINQIWREKQLEYSFRRALMNQYVDFLQCTQEALEFACRKVQVNLNTSEKNDLMQIYTKLPIFEDVKESLETLKNEGHHLFAFSNGSYQAITSLMQNAQIAELFKGFVSVEKTKTFKPNPVVYAHFNEETNSTKESSVLISGNSFDILGARAYGMNAVFLQRSPENILDKWEFAPNIKIQNLNELSQALKKID